VADRLDVAERLAEGRPAVEDTQSYVRACQMLGYQHPDLTSRPSQVRDWYDTEDGLDLRALDGDCAHLRAVVSVLTEALRMQCAQVDELTAAWTGPGADSAIGFLQRHCDAANTVATEVRAAAQRCESLRDNLWHLIDVKAATAIAIDDRTLAHRSAWLAAADVVTTGAGDRPTAEELVRQQIKPYVDNDIRNDWLTAMRSTQAAVAASYDMVVDRFAAAVPAYFEVPDDLRPGRAPFQPVRVSPPIATAAPVAAAAAPLAAHQPPDSPPPTMPAAPSDAGTALGDAAALPAAAGSSGGLGDLGGLGGLGGLANRIVEAMGGLLGSGSLNDSGDPFDGEPFDEDPFDEDPFRPDDKADDDEPDDDEPDDDADDKPEDLPVDEAQPVDGPQPAVAPQPAEAVPAVAPPLAAVPPPVAAPAPAAVPPVGAPPDGGKTPCEIAADELPQAGQ
jgi:hypothetical protein